MRTSWRRTWIKLYPVDCLDGSIRYQLEPDERGVWYDLLNFSAICATAGVISDKDNRAFPHSFVANRLNVSLELLERTLDKCKEEGRITEDSTGIHIVNWEAYQSEYQRQKPYRQEAPEKAKAVRGAVTDYTYDMFCQDHDEMIARHKKRVFPFKDRDDPIISTIVFFKDKYGKNKGRDYSFRFLTAMDFLNTNRDALIEEGLASPSEQAGKTEVEELVFQVILDSFSPPKPGTRGGAFPSSTLGEPFDLNLDKVLKAVKPLLGGEKLG